MFGKTTYAVVGIDITQDQIFRDLLTKHQADPELNLVAIDASLREDGGEGVGISSYLYPLGSAEDILLDSEIAPGLFALWFTHMEETSVQDPAVLKEHLSYYHYNKPFRFLDKEQKEDIQGLTESEPRTVKRLAAPILVDFNQGYLWCASINKTVHESLRHFLAENDIKTESLAFDFSRSSWPSEILTKVVEGTLYQDEFQERAEAIRKAGNPKLVEPVADPKLEKILKKYYRCAEHDGYYLFLAAPSKLHLGNEVTSVTVPSPSDATEVLNQGLGVAAARLTITEEDLSPIMSVDVSDITMTESGFIVVKGLESHRLNSAIRESTQANSRIDVKDFWLCDFAENQTCLFRFIQLVKDLLGLTEGGISRIETEKKTEVNG
jgi:hypothetical protein